MVQSLTDLQFGTGAQEARSIFFGRATAGRASLRRTRQEPLTILWKIGGWNMHNDRRSLDEIRHWLHLLLPSPGYKRLLNFLPLALVGAVFSMSCHLNRIAVALVFAGSHRRFLQRLRRWILRDTFAVDEVLLRAVRACLSPRREPIVLVVDRTEWGDHNLLYAAVPFRGRALPVAVQSLPDGSTHHTRVAALLDHAAAALPPATPVIVVADREFGNAHVIRVIRARGWHFCLRYKHDTRLQTLDGDRWQARDRFPRCGQRRLWSDVLVQEERSGPWRVAVFWGRGEKEPWVLVSDLPAERLVPLYRRRMRIEEMFSDLKSRGFNLEKTRLTDPHRLVRLACLLALAYLWMLLLATVAIRRGHRRAVDFARRRALSYLQIARRLLRHHPLEVVGPLIRAAGHAQLAK